MNADEVKEFMRFKRWNQKNAAAYDAYRRLSRRDGWKRFLAKSLAPAPAGARVLEVGSGTGFITSILAELGYRVEGIDLSEEMLARARTNLDREGFSSRVNLSQGDAEDLDFPDNHFDAVVSRWVLWTLPRPDVAIGEMSRVLKPGGTAALVDGGRLKPSAFGRLRSDLTNWVMTGRRPGWQGQGYKEIEAQLPHYNPDQAAGAFRDSGLEIREVQEKIERFTDGRIYFWLTGGAWTSYFVKAVKPA